jgi:hypothetical protein
VIDIVSGAIDAWLSADVRRATRAPGIATDRGGSMTVKSILACDRGQWRASKLDALIGAGVMIGATLVLTALGTVAKRAGWPVASEIVLGMSFPVSLLLSMPFWLMKGQSWKAQAGLIGGMLMILVGLSCLASL